MGRIVLPNYPHHIVQRGQTVRWFLRLPRIINATWRICASIKDAFGVRVYAYCLMTNHVHLLLAPGESVERIKGDRFIF
ncbi:transposase [Pseudomonas sp. Z1-14]|uniref:transposase n=1 Tax=Pseudomonas sp. Z1-14 TaxID=2817409 RepID=UPI003DA80836